MATIGCFMTDDFPSRKLDKIVIRLPEGLRERIAERAKRRRRSVNAELVSLLELHYRGEEPLTVVLERAQSALAALKGPTDKDYSVQRALGDLRRLEFRYREAEADSFSDEERQEIETIIREYAQIEADIALRLQKQAIANLGQNVAQSLRDEIAGIARKTQQVVALLEQAFPELTETEPRKADFWRVPTLDRP
jgi:hypothetical protein